MDIFLLMIISVIAFFAANFIKTKLKIAPPIIYLGLGVLFGANLGFFNFFGNPELVPNLGIYNSIALLLMFFGSGFSSDMKLLKNSGKVTTQLFTLPVVVEAVIGAGILFGLTTLVPALGFKFNFFEALLITSIFACSSPANIIPICTSLTAEGYDGKNKIASTVTIASIGDNFAPFPVLLIALLFSVAPKLGMSLTPMNSVLALVGCTLGLVLIGGIGVLIGLVIAKLLTPLGNKIAQNPTNKVFPILYALISFTIVALIVNFTPLKSLGILVAAAAGGSIKSNDKTGTAGQAGTFASIFFGILCMPIVFMYVGSLVDLQALFNPVMLIFCLVITFIAIALKGATVFGILKKSSFTDGEKKFAASACIPKGVTLINFSILLMPILYSANMEYIVDFSIMLAAVAVLVTIPLGVTFLSSAKDKWLILDKQSQDKMSA